MRISQKVQKSGLFCPQRHQEQLGVRRVQLCQQVIRVQRSAGCAAAILSLSDYIQIVPESDFEVAVTITIT
jgi:hypothetical protein